jgi:predicted AlkP superfamily phosphohydrolase/phosphomutase
VDWSRTRAYGQRSVHIYVNTRGRDPEGIVEPGEAYEAVRERVLKVLHEHVDPATGLKPIVLALRREDARILGHCDDRSGDILYAVDPRFYKEHGPHLPTARVGIGDLRSLFLMAGPGVKRGVTLERTVWLTDVVPTVCHLAELPVPRQCEGGIIYQALEDPDAQVKELQALRRLTRSSPAP